MCCFYIFETSWHQTRAPNNRVHPVEHTSNGDVHTVDIRQGENQVLEFCGDDESSDEYTRQDEIQVFRPGYSTMQISHLAIGKSDKDRWGYTMLLVWKQTV